MCDTRGMLVIVNIPSKPHGCTGEQCFTGGVQLTQSFGQLASGCDRHPVHLGGGGENRSGELEGVLATTQVIFNPFHFS